MRLRPWRRHSLVLAVLGAAYALIGLTYTLTTPADTRTSALKFALNIMPLSAWGFVFIAVGLLGVISSRWPPASETWGYVAMSTLSALWGCFYFFGALDDAPVSTLTGGLLWMGMAFLWWAISGLQNPPTKQDQLKWSELSAE